VSTVAAAPTNRLRAAVARSHLLGRRAVARRFVDLARRSGARTASRPGVTVATVTWNSLDYLRCCLDGIRRFSDPVPDILVVDNRSTDGTRAFLAEQPDVRTIRSPLNLGHGLGLDLAFARAETDVVVALDVDAFPIAPEWLSVVLDPLAQGAVVAGAYVQRAFIHPSFLAMRRSDYLRLGVRFMSIGVPTAPGGTPHGLFMDVGEALSQTVAVVAGSAALHRIPITTTSGDNLVGSVYGDVVYHNFYATQGRPELAAAANVAWSDAVARYLPGQ
jgi:glycosyltransferase involved in cell wall biosynthesis